jgi:hypothetical protein
MLNFVGGKHFSRNLAPLGPDGEEPEVESSTPDKWAVNTTGV